MSLVKFCQKEFDGKFQMHCTAVIENVLAPRFKRKLDKMVKEAPGYHSKVDKSMDVSAVTQLCFSVRFLNSETNCNPVTFLNLKEVSNETAEVMHCLIPTWALKKVLE